MGSIDEDYGSVGPNPLLRTGPKSCLTYSGETGARLRDRSPGVIKTQ